MARAAIPTPIVRATTLGQARPAGAALPELWRLFLAHSAALVSAGALSESRLAQLKTTARRCAGLPEFPEQAHVRQWLDAMAGKGTTKKGEFWNLHSAYAWGLASNHVAYNPCFRLKYKVAKPKRHAILDVYEKWSGLLECCEVLGESQGHGHRMQPGDVERAKAFFGVLRFGGLRVSEALGLEVPHVETWKEPWRLQVRQQRNEQTLVPDVKLKNEHSRRGVDVHRELKELLAPVLALGAGKVFEGKGGQTLTQTPFLFPFRKSQLARLMARLRERFPVDFPPDDAWHVWRHTCAVYLRRRGIEVDVISKFLGHESVHYTQEYLRGFLGAESANGIYAGIEGAPEWAVAARAVATQETLKLGVLGAVRRGARATGAVVVERGRKKTAEARGTALRPESIPGVSELKSLSNSNAVRKVVSQ